MGLLDQYNPNPDSGFNEALLAAAQALLTPRARGGGMGAAFGAFPRQMGLAQEQARRNKALGMQEREFELNVSEAERRREEAAQQRAQMEAYAQSLPPEQRQMFMLNPSEFIKSQIPKDQVLSPGAQLWRGGKAIGQAPFKPESAPELTRLLAQRDALPEGHPYRSVYDQQIQKMTTHQPATKVEVNTGTRSDMWGEPPKGYVWARDPASQQVMTQKDPSGAVAPLALPIAGSKEARERASDQDKSSQRQAYAQNVTGTVLSAVREAKKAVGPLSAGLGGSIMGAVPGSPAVNLKALIDPIKANIGFQRLQEMREMSPTGGALGQVAVQELNMLQSVISSLDQSQSPDQLRRSLDKIERHFTNWANAVNESAKQESPKVEQPKRKRYNPATGQLE